MTAEDTDRAAGWLQAIEEEARRQAADHELPDPWADAVPATPELTDDQRDRLEGLDDQPAVARLAYFDPDDASDLAGLETGPHEESALGRAVDDFLTTPRPPEPDPTDPGS